MAGAAAAAVNETLSEWLVVALIVFSLIFQLLLHHVEAWVCRRHPHLQPVMHVVYRELMVLGLVSILFLMYAQLARPNATAVHSFEFAHVFIFALAIFFVAAVMCALAASLRLSAHWKAIEHVALPHYRALKAEYTAVRLRMHSRPSRVWRALGWWLANPKRLTRYRFLHEVLAFHDLRFQTIFFRRLPDDFRFSAFLRRIKGVYFVHLVEPHYTLWLLFLAAMLADLVRRYAAGQTAVTARLLSIAVRADAVPTAKELAPQQHIAFEEDVVGSAMLIAFALALMLFVQILALKIRLVYWHLTKNPRIYYAHIHAAATTSYQLDNNSLASAEPFTTLPANTHSPISLNRPNPHHATPILVHPTSTPTAASAPRQSPTPSQQSLEAQIWDQVPTTSPPLANSSRDRKSRPGVSFCDSTIVESVTPSNRLSSDERDLEAHAAPSPEQLQAPSFDSATGRATAAPPLETRESAMQNELLKHKSLAVQSPTLAKKKEEFEQARQLTVNKYPWLVTKLIPRLARVASRAEKLFWFGSHHFFFWCVQFSLFFSTVAVAASTASVLLRLFNGDPVTSLNIAAMVVSVICLLFMQLRVAFMLKKYVFVLVSAALLPDDLVKRTVRDLKHKRVFRAWDKSSVGDEEILEEEDEDEENEEDSEEANADLSALRMRKTIGQYFREEAERGELPGVSGAEIIT